MPKIGEIYNKKYELQELIGGGNYSEVYKAKEIKSGEIVAIKIIDVAQTVLREGKIYDAISNAKLSDGITPLLDRDNKNKVPEYFVFPYREAGSLSGRIKNLDYELKISYSIKLLETLSSLHDADIIHRDLKPQNILIDDEGLPEITDFGIGKTIFTTLSGSTQGTIAGGTRNYGAPEQFEKGAATDKYTDVFAMSKLLYEILSGGESLTSVFEDNNLVEIRYTSPLSNFDKRFSSYVDDVIKKGLNFDPKERYKDAKELQVALLAAIAKKDNPLKPVIDFTKKNVRNLAISTSLAAALFLGILFWPEPETIIEEKIVEVMQTPLPQPTLVPEPTSVPEPTPTPFMPTPTPLAESGEGLSGSLSTEGGETTITIEPTPQPTPEPNQINPILSKPFGEKEFPDGTFHLGSTYDEVISVMGEPDNLPPEQTVLDELSVIFKRGDEYNGYIRYRDESLNESRIYFYDEKVIAWEDKGDLKLYDFKIEINDEFNLGSSITEVLQIQGNPKTISIDTINIKCCVQIPRVWIYGIEDEFQDASISFSSVWSYSDDFKTVGSPDEFDYVVQGWDQVKSFLRAPVGNFGPSPSMPQAGSSSPEPQVSNPQPQQQSTPQQSTPQQSTPQPTATPVPAPTLPSPDPAPTPVPSAPTPTQVPLEFMTHTEFAPWCDSTSGCSINGGSYSGNFTYISTLSNKHGSDIEIDDQGNLYNLNPRDGIQKINPSGGIEWSVDPYENYAASTQLNWIAIYPKSNPQYIYVGTYSRVLKFSALDGQNLGEIVFADQQDEEQFKGISVDSNGLLYVASLEKNSIKVYDDQGNMQRTIAGDGPNTAGCSGGNGGTGGGKAPGQLCQPTNFNIYNDFIYIRDRGGSSVFNNGQRYQKLNLNGDHVFSWQSVELGINGKPVVDNSGRLYLALTDNPDNAQGFATISSDGQSVEKFTGLFSGQCSGGEGWNKTVDYCFSSQHKKIAVDKNGYVYILNDSGVRKYSIP